MGLNNIISRLWILVFVVAGFSSQIPAAHSDTIEALDAEQLETMLTNAGLDPDMRVDSATGAPVAVGKVGDSEFEFVMRGLNCSGSPKACSELMFFANFPLGRALTVQDLVAVNNYNETKVFGRAYALRTNPSAGAVGIDYVIELGGGVSAEHVEENISRWADVVASFINVMTGGEAGS